MNSKTLYVGIDVSNHHHDIAVMGSNKKLLGKVFSIDENEAGFCQLIAKLKQFQKQSGAKQVFIGLEATGDYWKNLTHFLRESRPDYHITVINPIQTNAFSKTELRRAITDPVSAKDIARFMLEKSPPPTPRPSPPLEAIKDLDTQLCHLKKRQTMAINRLRSELSKVAPEIEQAISDFTGKRILVLLAQYPTAQSIRDASTGQLRSLRYGKRKWSLPYTFITKIKALAQNSVAHKSGEAAGWVVQSLVREVSAIGREVENLQTQQRRLYQKCHKKSSLLVSIPGISLEMAIVLEAYIGDIQRFRGVKPFIAYFGMNPTIHLSGSSVKKSSHLEKKGSARVRQLLFLAVLTMIGHRKKPIYQYYQRLLKNGKPKLVAMAAAMRKLLAIIYAILKKQQPFDPEYEEKNRRGEEK